MMEGTFNLGNEKGIDAPDAHGTEQRQSHGDPVGQSKPVRQHVLGYVDSLAEIDGKHAGQGDHTAHRHVEVSGDQDKRDADAQDDDEPVVRDQVEHILGFVEVRHKSWRWRTTQPVHRP
jgi:hypothetical protein